MPDGGTLPVALHAKQASAFLSTSTEMLYGGAAGGGKSHLIRVAAIDWCLNIPGLQVYIFRRIEDDLIKNHMEGPKGFRNMLAPLQSAGTCRITELTISFYNGSKIFLCHCKDETHRYKYHGSEIHVLIVDELTTFTEVIYRYLRFRTRMVGINLPTWAQAGQQGRDGRINPHNLFPRILCASNPGNIGHHWVKRTFIDHAAPMTPWRTDEAEGGLVRQYIPALLDDNPSMASDDPTYRARMRGLGDPALVRAMELGDWNIVAGGYFPEFSLHSHVIRSTDLPKEVFSKRFRAADWGSARPFSTGWYAICDEDWKTTGTLGNPILVPRGAIVRYREWYGIKTDEKGRILQDNVGIKMPVEQWASGVMARTQRGEDPVYTVCDTSMFDEDGGPSLAERAETVKFDGNPDRMNMRRADKRRLPGWDQVRARLTGWPNPDGVPLLYLMDTAEHAIRTIQSVQHDELKIEDLDTDGEDHAVDEIRYACMSRYRPLHKPVPRKPDEGAPKPWTLPWLDRMENPDRAKYVSTYQMND